ncbi:MAG: DUF3828 domain-containing protein [Bacteroidaceae bacterium]|nr:DUF3828 domain-containing protein [Bacteroidaceae bacterium]
MRYCKFCGRELPSDARFCPFCGREVAERPVIPTNKSGDKSDCPVIGDMAPQYGVYGNNDNEPKKGKKKNALWGCTIVTLIVAIVAAGALYTYNAFFAKATNALIPEDEDSVAVAPNVDTLDIKIEEEKDIARELTQEDREAMLRRRVQKIYEDVLRMDTRASYVGRYCTTRFQEYYSMANATGEHWIGVNFWIFAQDYNRPVLEQIRVATYTDEDATVKVAVRPFANGQVVNVLTLKMQKSDGAWLIDDFMMEGRSVRTMARMAIEEAQIRNEIMADTLPE